MQSHKVRCFVLHAETGSPVNGAVVTLSVTTHKSHESVLGVLRSDRAGYISFDLSKFGASFPAGKLWLTPVDEPGAKIELLAAPNGATAPTTETRSPPDLTNSRNTCAPFILRVSNAPSANDGCDSPTLPAVQNPDPCDYQLSPSSFVTTAPKLLGDGCCETLAPSALPTQEYVLRRVVVRTLAASSSETTKARALQPINVSQYPKRPPGVLRFGEVLEYRQEWIPLGHSLGEILYSLALAPGEATEIAVVDWSRQDQVSRTDDITSTEFLANQLNRDRSIDETVNSMLNETQDGWSLMGGTAGAASYSYGTFAIAGDHSIGGSVGHSSGDRNLEADSLQSLHDSTNQSTGVTRKLNSTVVMQSSQAEQNVLRTRRVANHNHCHALTIEYYEVVRSFCLRTRFVGRRKAILIPFEPFMFDWPLAVRFRTLLVPNLLDLSLAPAFDAILRSHYGSALYQTGSGAPPPTTTPAPTTSYFTGHKSITIDPTAPNDPGIFIQKGSRIRLTASGNIKVGGTHDTLGNVYGPDGDGSITGSGWYAPGKYSYSLIFRLGSTWYQGGSSADVLAPDDDYMILQVNDQVGALSDNSGSWTVQLDVAAPPNTPAPTDPTSVAANTPAGAVTKDGDIFSEKMLLQHLNGNRGYYNRVVWTMMDDSDRRLFIEAALSSYPDVAAGVDSAPLAVSGNDVAFPYDGPVPNWTDTRPGDPQDPLESIVTLPTRGVFAEAMLGHCNACEPRDVTRMWDWTEMTTEEPPPITDISPGPRGTPETVAQGALPQNVVQISQPPAAPDPIGLAAALRVMGTPNIFRDMSRLQEVSSLLNTLANGAVTSLAGAQKVAQQAQQKIQTMQAQQGQGGGGTVSGQQSAPSAAQTYDNLTTAKEVAKAAPAMGWTPQTTEAVTSGIVSGNGGGILGAVLQQVMGAAPPPPKTATANKFGIPGFRTCCLLGQWLHGGTGSMDPTSLAGHAYGSSGGNRGYIYTAHAGLVDIGHVRDLCDMTKFIFDSLVAGYTRLELYEGVAEINQSPASILDAAASIAYVESWAHELTTWGTFSGDSSSFSPEDLPSNIIGTEVARRAIMAGGPFDVAVDTALYNLINIDLAARPKADTDAVLTKITGDWFADGLTLLNIDLLRRNFDGSVWPAGMPYDAPVSLPWLDPATFASNYGAFTYSITGAVNGATGVTLATMQSVTDSIHAAFIAANPGKDHP